MNGVKEHGKVFNYGSDLCNVKEPILARNMMNAAMV